MDGATTESVNPLHIMDDEELVSLVCMKYKDMVTDDPDLHKIEFKKFRTELMYRLRRSHIEAWTPPKRLMEGK